MKNKPLPGLDDVLMYRLYRFGRLLRFHLQKHLDAGGDTVTPEQFFLLYRLYMEDGQTQRQLADRVMNDHPNITRLIDRLEEKGHVRRRAADTDHRIYNIHLSEKGRMQFQGAVPVITRERERMLKGISREEIKTVQRVLARMEENIKG